MKQGKHRRQSRNNKGLKASVIVAAAGASTVLAAGSAIAATPSDSPRAVHLRLRDPHIIAGFDYAAGQTAEDVVVEPDGSADLTLARANEVVHVGLNGSVRTVAQLPASGNCPVLGGAEAIGLARGHGGALYVVECTGDANQGVWKLEKGHPPVQIAQLPPEGIPSEMTLDECSGDLYVSDGLLGRIWKVSTHGGPATVWATGPQLAPAANFFGVNGIAFHRGAVWAVNSGQGTILRIPVNEDGSAGAVQTVYTGLAGTGADNLEVVGKDTVIAAEVYTGDVVALRPGAQPQVLLTAADGLQNPDDVAIAHGRLYVTSGAYVTGTNPNLLVADIEH